MLFVHIEFNECFFGRLTAVAIKWQSYTSQRLWFALLLQLVLWLTHAKESIDHFEIPYKNIGGKEGCCQIQPCHFQGSLFSPRCNVLKYAWGILFATALRWDKRLTTKRTCGHVRYTGFQILVKRSRKQTQDSKTGFITTSAPLNFKRLALNFGLRYPKLCFSFRIMCFNSLCPILLLFRRCLLLFFFFWFFILYFSLRLPSAKKNIANHGYYWNVG